MADSKRDYYDVLGVPRDADQKTITAAWKKHARRLHPDVNKAPDAEERFKEVSEAYDVLSDETKRARYDNGGNLNDTQSAPSQRGYDINEAFHGRPFSRSFREQLTDYLRTGNWTAIQSIVTDNFDKIDDQITAAVELVGYYKNTGDYDNAVKVISRTEEPRISEIFLNSLSEIAAKAVRIKPATDRIITDIAKDNRVKIDVRVDAGNKELEYYKNNIHVVEAIARENYPNLIKERAGTIAVSYYFDKNDWYELYSLAVNNDNSKHTRTEALKKCKETIDTICKPLAQVGDYRSIKSMHDRNWNTGQLFSEYLSQAVERAIDNADPKNYDLIRIFKSDLPLELREKAADKKLDNEMTKLGKMDTFWHIESALHNSGYPENSVARAWKKLITIWTEEGNYQHLVSLSRSDRYGIPRIVQKEADRNITIAAQNALDQAVTVGNLERVREIFRDYYCPSEVKSSANSILEEVKLRARVTEATDSGAYYILLEALKNPKTPVDVITLIEQGFDGVVATYACNRERRFDICANTDLPAYLRVKYGLEVVNDLAVDSHSECRVGAIIWEEVTKKQYPELVREKLGLYRIQSMINTRIKVIHEPVYLAPLVALDYILQLTAKSSELKALKSLIGNESVPDLVQDAAKEASSFRSRIKIFFGRYATVNEKLKEFDREMQEKVAAFNRKHPPIRVGELRKQLKAA